MKLYLFIIAFFLSENFGFSFSIQENETNPKVKYDKTLEVTPVSFDQTITKKYQIDPHFDYTEKTEEDNLWQKFKRWLSRLWMNFWSWLFGDFKSNSILVFLYKVFPYLVVGGIVIFLIWLFYRLNPGSGLLYSKEEAKVFFTDEEKIIKSQNIQALIDDALIKKDYRLAVRYYFLLILKSLSDNKLINYEFDKTNSDYLKEIKQDLIAQKFKKSAVIYEYVWYGNFDVSETDFNKAKIQFVALKNNINQGE